MEDEVEAVEEATAPRDVMAEMLTTLGELDPNALLLNFFTIVEWMEPDGEPSMSVFGTRMAPWHVEGLLSHVLSDIQTKVAVHSFMVDDEDEDDF